MSNTIRNILYEMRRDKKREKIEQSYEEQERLIPYHIYHELKARRKCQRCRRKFDKPLKIHHRIAIKDGGRNNIENLMLLCDECHKILDDKQKGETNGNKN